MSLASVQKMAMGSQCTCLEKQGMRCLCRESRSPYKRLEGAIQMLGSFEGP